MSGKLKMGMVGGGQGAFIGAVHRIAAALDNDIELVCGAFSSTAKKSLDSGKELFIEPHRIYSDFNEMMEKESNLPVEDRMDFVSIVTPNHMHFPIAIAALEAGFHVICDKPMTLNVKEAEILKEKVQTTQKLFALTHTYTGYPMIKEAKQLVETGKLGKIRKVITEYNQGWLSEEQSMDNKQASWRTNPKYSGISGCMADIGSHAANLAEYVLNQNITAVNAELSKFVDGRELDDDGMALIKFEQGAKGILQASQIATGEENNLILRVYGEYGGIEWHQQEPNTLIVKWLNQPTQIYRTGGNLSPQAALNTRTPMGHPEGYLEAFANIYKSFSKAIRAKEKGTEISNKEFDFPSVEDGLHGMKLIEALVASSMSDSKWTQV